MKRYVGGCAVMIKIPAQRLMHFRDHTREWARYSHWDATDGDDDHLTLQFIGRDLNPNKVTSAMVAAFVFAGNDPSPMSLRFSGVFKINTTSKGSYLVAEIEKDEALMKARERIKASLAQMDVTPKDSFDFNPHVTLMEAPPGAIPKTPPAPLDPFVIECNELVFKYGPRRLVIDL
jgi:2'-5' RNA ligase